SDREGDETILPLVAALARESGATVRLLRVYAIPEIIVGTNGRVVAYVDQEMARLNGEGLARLQAAEFRLDGVSVEHVVRFGEPVEEIVLEAEAWSADLIALSTSNRGRLWSAISPGVADQVSRQTTTPTLALRA
ncbi:MAG: universal stress protein, partial [Candidatus Rokuibacteriota bacterium]